MSSEQLADGVNPLDAELAATWDVLKGYSGRDTDLGIARRFGGASAAYSLRDIGAMNNRVVKVRRDVDGDGTDKEEDFSANQVQSGALEDWVNGKLESTLPADVATAAAAYSLRKVKSDYGIPVTEVNGTDGFPATITGSEQTITGTSFTVRQFSNGSPDSSEATAVNGVYSVSATKTSTASFAKAIRIKGLEDGKQYTVKGEFRMVEDTTSGGDSSATVDISDNTAGTDEDAVTTTSTTFVPFFIDAGYNSGGSDNFIDFTVNTVGSEAGTITAEFRNVQIIENNNSAVRIRRSSDDEEVVVGFDSDNKVSASSPVTATPSGSTNATDLNGFLNEVLDDRFSGVTYPDDISDGQNTGFPSSSSNYRQWNTITPTSNSFVATTGTVTSTGARYVYALPSLLTTEEADGLKFKLSGTVNYTVSSGDGFLIKGNIQTNGDGTGNLTNSTLTGAGALESGNLRFTNGDSGDFVFEYEGISGTTFRGLTFIQDEVTSGTSSISLTNLKFEIIEHGATVHTWYDQAGVNNAVQETAGNQPKIAENGSLLADGLDFDGSASYLDASSTLGATSTIGIFTVIKPDNTDIDAFIFDGRDANDDGARLQQSNLDSGKYLFSMDTTDVFSASGAVSSNETLVTAIQSSTAATLFKNSTQLATAADDAISVTSGYRIGANQVSTGTYFDGTMKEIILFTSDQSDNRFKIESNINNYYGLYNDANEFSGNPTAEVTPSAITLTNVSKTGFTAEISATSGVKQINFPLLNSLVSGDDYFVSFDYTSTNTSNAVGVKPRTSALGSASNDVMSATNSGFYGGTGDASHNGFDVNNTATVLSFQTTAQSFTFTVSNLRVSRIARNGFVETWYDQSGNGNDATQETAGNQPAIVQNGSITTSNGSPSVFFTGDTRDDELDFTDLTLTDATIFTVVNIDSSADQQILLGGSSSTSTGTMIPMMDNGSSTTQVYKNSTVGGAEQGSSQFKNGSQITLANRNDAFDNLAVDSQILFTMVDVDVAEAKVLDGISRTPSDALTFHLQGQMNELIIYNSDLSSDRGTIESEIANHYNITLS